MQYVILNKIFSIKFISGTVAEFILEIVNKYSHKLFVVPPERRWSMFPHCVSQGSPEKQNQ